MARRRLAGQSRCGQAPLTRCRLPAPRCRQVQPNELVIKPAAFQPKQTLTDADVERAM
jgi:hypothetical protein